jgi:vesicle coat complex subunit
MDKAQSDTARRKMKQSESNPHLQAAIMEVVENQLRNNDPPQTGQTFKRLIEAGHSEKEAKRLIACVVSAEIFDVLKKNEPFNLDRFIKCLNKLPAMPWEEEES